MLEEYREYWNENSKHHLIVCSGKVMAMRDLDDDHWYPWERCWGDLTLEATLLKSLSTSRGLTREEVVALKLQGIL